MGTMAEGFNSNTSGGSGGNGQLAVEVNMDAVRKHVADLGRMLTSNNDTYKKIKNIIRKELRQGRNDISKDVQANLGSDPRKAYRAVRHSIYKSILGGNINILSPRKAGARYMLIRQRTLRDGQWGGNRRERSQRTEALETYFGKDRGFVLRFNNSGTGQRHISIGPNAILGGNRGIISPRGVFAHSALFQMNAIADRISKALSEELGKINAENQ
jgi:hypothetical protein